MQTQFLTRVFVIACVAAGIFSQNCIRKEYHGGPQNTIIKAYEAISDQMQAANLLTEVYWLTSNENTITPEGSAIHEWLFTVKVLDSAGAVVETYALIMQITDYCDETFVDQILWMPIRCNDTFTGTSTVAADVVINGEFNSTVVSGSFWDWRNPADAADSAAFFCTATNFKSCNILKENFTYFYEIAGNIFAPTLNN